MTQYLPANLLALFAPRDPIPYLPPVDKLPYEKQTAGYTGISAYVSQFEDPETTPAPVKFETREERQERKRKAKAEATAYKLEQDIALWSPTNNPLSTSDPYKTLFVARVNYDTSEAKLRREFEIYGVIKKITIVHDKDGKPRGYAFIEYERERDMHSAYKHADGKKIDGRRVLVDVERGRTVKGWLPRRLGGGLGGTRRGGPDVNVKHSGREETRNEERGDRYAGGGKDRAVDRERERPERPERRRSRSRSRERRRRSPRSRSRERHRGERHAKRDRSRDRNRDRSAVPDPEKADGNSQSALSEAGPPAPDGAPPPSRERRRRSSRDRDHKRRRSRSRDRKGSRRDHDRGSDRDHDRSERRKGDRGGDKDKKDGVQQQDDGMGMPQDITIKEEPMDPEPSQDGFNNEEYNNDGPGDYKNENSYNNGDGEMNEAGEGFF